MKVRMKSAVELDEEEAETLKLLLGKLSYNAELKLGMTNEQAVLLNNMYSELDEMF